MTLVDALFNAAGGGIFGSALHVITDYFDTKNKVTMLNAQINAAEKTEAWKAFAASQGGNESISIPANVPGWAASFYLCVDGVKQLTRPLLTWASVAIIAGAYFSSAPAQQAEMQAEIVFGCFTAVFWYFGARYVKNK